MTAFSYAKDVRPAFVAHMAARLDARLCAQARDLFEAHGVNSPVTSSSILIFLNRRGPGTIADICRIDGQSHQLATSRLTPLLKDGFVQASADPHDGRRQLLSLTRKGRAEAKKLEAACSDIAHALKGLNEEFGVDLMFILESAEKALARTPLIERVNGGAYVA